MAAWHKPSRDRLRLGHQRLANRLAKVTARSLVGCENWVGMKVPTSAVVFRALQVLAMTAMGATMALV